MASVTTCFFSQLLGCPVLDESGEVLGNLEDLSAVPEGKRLKITAVAFVHKGVQTVVEPGAVTLEQSEGRIALEIADFLGKVPDALQQVKLRAQVLGKKVVDLKGRRIVRIGDLKLHASGGELTVVAVDAGLASRLRRWKMDGTAKKLFAFWGSTTPMHLIPWEDVEAVGAEHRELLGNREDSSLKSLHPADLADILEDLDHPTQMEVFSSLDDEQAADVLEELESDARIGMIQRLPVDKAADILEKMPADEAADILDELAEAKAEALLNEMEIESSEDVRELMEYPENTVGSLMSTDFVSFDEHHTVEETIRALRKLKPESNNIYYLYVVDAQEHLLSTVSLRDVIVSEPNTTLNEIMNRNVIYVYDTDRIDSLNDIVSKYSLLAVPVVDANKKLVGMAIINDIMESLMKSRRIKGW